MLPTQPQGLGSCSVKLYVVHGTYDGRGYNGQSVRVDKNRSLQPSLLNSRRSYKRQKVWPHKNISRLLDCSVLAAFSEGGDGQESFKISFLKILSIISKLKRRWNRQLSYVSLVSLPDTRLHTRFNWNFLQISVSLLLQEENKTAQRKEMNKGTFCTTPNAFFHQSKWPNPRRVYSEVSPIEWGTLPGKGAEGCSQNYTQMNVHEATLEVWEGKRLCTCVLYRRYLV